MVERVLSMHEVPGSMPGSYTLTFVFFSVKSVCCCENVYQSKLELRGGISSNGRGRAKHARGTGIDARILHVDFCIFFCEECLLV